MFVALLAVLLLMMVSTGIPALWPVSLIATVLFLETLGRRCRRVRAEHDAEVRSERLRLVQQRRRESERYFGYGR